MRLQQGFAASEMGFRASLHGSSPEPLMSLSQCPLSAKNRTKCNPAKRALFDNRVGEREQPDHFSLGKVTHSIAHECHTGEALATACGQTVTSSLLRHWTMISADRVFRPV
jgi:hypothetical protein